MSTSPKFIEGGISVDDRGKLTFCNNFKMQGIKRFYQVTNHRPNFVRAWHGHKKERKYLFVSKGTVMVALVHIIDWEDPDPDAEVIRFVLSDSKPGILFIPEGHAHGYKTLTGDASILFFSTADLDASLDDDYRYDPYHWDPWKITER